MQEALHDFMRVGLVHFMAWPDCMGGEGPILDTVQQICEDPFFEVLEITTIKDGKTRAAVTKLADEARLTLCYGAQPILLSGGLDLNNQDKNQRQQAIKAVTAAIDEAAAMGIASLAVVSGKVCDDYEAGKERLVDSLNTLCAHGATKGVSLVLETFDQVKFGKNCLIGPTKDAVDVAREVCKTHDDFGILLDLSHLPLQDEDPGEALDAAGEYLVHVHIGNCAMDDPKHPAYGDNHPRFGAPGTRNDIEELAVFLRSLRDRGYLNAEERKIVSFEVKPMPGETPETVIAGSKRALLDAWRMA